MEHCRTRIGDAYFRTPRNTIKAFLDLLAVLEQNPHLSWDDLVASSTIATDTDPDLEALDDEGDPPPSAASSSESRDAADGATVTINTGGGQQVQSEAASGDELSSFRL